MRRRARGCAGSASAQDATDLAKKRPDLLDEMRVRDKEASARIGESPPRGGIPKHVANKLRGDPLTETTGALLCTITPMTASHRIEVTTDDGIAPCWIHSPSDEGKYPGVIMFPDAGSVRPAAQDMAEKLAEAGYVVILPNIFYRSGDYPPFDLSTVFTDPKERTRLGEIMKALDMASAMRDVVHYVRVLREQPNIEGDRIGVCGYCFGGRLAFTAAGAHPKDVAAAACFHAGGLVTDAPESPHLAADKITANLYFGVADNDGSFTPEHQGTLATALGKAHVDYTIELYKGAAHGFAMPDFPIYDKAADARHWDRMFSLFKRSLPAG